MNAPVGELKKIESREVVVRFTEEEWAGLECLDADLFLEACGLKGFIRLVEVALINEPDIVIEEIDTILMRAKFTAENIRHMVETRLDGVMQRGER
jgi:hypothetical protein